MKVNLQNIVNSAVERGIIEGYTHITSDNFKGTADDAVGCLLYSVIANIEEYILFDDEEQHPDKKIGFNTSAKSTTELEGYDDGNDGQEVEQFHKFKNRIKPIKFKR